MIAATASGGASGQRFTSLLYERHGRPMNKILLAVIISIVGSIHDFSSAADLQVVTVALVSPSWNTGLPTAFARGAGFFKEEGLDVRPVTLSSSSPIMMALLMSGQADFVIA